MQVAYGPLVVSFFQIPRILDAGLRQGTLEASKNDGIKNLLPLHSMYKTINFIFFFITNLFFPSLYSLRCQKMEALEFPCEGECLSFFRQF